MNEIMEVPVKVINEEKWLFFINFFSKATVRAIGMRKQRRVQDTGHHHCFEIDVEGNIRLKPKNWNPKI